MPVLRIHYLQHVPFEGPGFIADWARTNGHQLSTTQLHENSILPALDTFDWLIVMGGPMNIYDEENVPFLRNEKLFIKGAIDSGKTVLGICLGAQLIAAVLGARIYANAHKEIGWFPVNLTSSGQTHPLLADFDPSFMSFHWHGDTFDLPEGAIHLMASDVCKHQAFLFKERVLALQFHFETTEHSLKEIVENCKDEIVNAPFIQTAEVMLSKSGYIAENNARLQVILERLSKYL